LCLFERIKKTENTFRKLNCSATGALCYTIRHYLALKLQGHNDIFEWNFGHILGTYIGTDFMYLGQVFVKRDNWSGWPEVDVMITIFGDFRQFSAIFDNFRRKNWLFFSKINVMIKILHNLCSFVLSQKRQFFRRFFRRKYFKNHNIGSRWVCEKVAQNIAQPILCQNYFRILIVEKSGPKMWAISVILPEVISHRLGENSPNLVTLIGFKGTRAQWHISNGTLGTYYICT
jgi:hypothetical protein